LLYLKYLRQVRLLFERSWVHLLPLPSNPTVV